MMRESVGDVHNAFGINTAKLNRVSKFLKIGMESCFGDRL